jgi:ABC transporter
MRYRIRDYPVVRRAGGPGFKLQKPPPLQFSGDDVDKKIRALSGGKKSRLAIARMLFNPPNFLVLDEPTNHLDLATKEMLVDALKDFEGTMIFVSHDRMFLRGLGSCVLELGGESGTDRNPTVYPGSYVEYVQKLTAASGGWAILALSFILKGCFALTEPRHSSRPKYPAGARSRKKLRA